jgi:hypothetical protein
MRTSAPILSLLLLAALALPQAALAAGETRATGKWTVAGKSVELAHARVYREADPFGRGTNPCVLASTEPVPDEALPTSDEGIAKLLDRMRSGKLRALAVCFDESGRRLRDVNDLATFHPDVSPGRHTYQGFAQFAPAGAAAGRIAGKLTGSGTTVETEAPWSVELELSVPMPAKP